MTDLVEITINGKTQSGWTRYDIDSSLLVPADAWHVGLSCSSLKLDSPIDAGAPVEVRVGGDVVMSGRLDNRVRTVQKSGKVLDLDGRDGAAVLVDCSAPIFGQEELTLEQVVAKIVRPLGINRVRIDAETQLLRDRVCTEPGDTAWQALQRAAEANGLWPWFEPDGTLVVGGPNYDSPVVDELVMLESGPQNNLVSLRERKSMSVRHSEVTVLGQSIGTNVRMGKPNVRATVQDTGVPSYRPLVVVDHEATNEAIARARATKIISDERVKSFDLQAVILGKRNASGTLWAPGQRVRVVSEPHDLDGTYFCLARRFTESRAESARATLTLCEDRAWVVTAHPHHRKHRRGKNGLPGVIVDLTAPTGGAQ
jgi:prophage tail gpP-like protein